MKTMYKLSRYTINTMNSQGQMLLYNTLVGKKSMCKLPKPFSSMEKINNLLVAPQEHSEMVSKLLEKGIIVEDSNDERQVLYECFLAAVSPTYLTLHINPTEKCNFRCKYCYESFEKGSMTPDVEQKVIAYVEQNIHKYTGLHISWFGGEPLLALDCIRNLSQKFKRICKYYKIPYSATMTTNGYLLTPDHFNELLELDVKRYQITVDGMKGIHDNQRVLTDGRGTFDTIINNLQCIHSSGRRDFEIIVRSNITNEVLVNLDEYIDTIQTICQNDDRFVFDFHKVGNWMGKASDSIVPKIINNLDDLGYVYDKLLKSSFSGRINFNMYYPGNGSCYAGKRNQFLIRSNGDLHKCTVDFEVEGTQIGLLKNGQLQLNDNYYSTIVNINNCPNFYDCFFAPVCMGTPCPKDVNSGCPYTKDYIEITLQILDKNYPLELITE